MKVSVVISIKDRVKLFRRSLKLYKKQTCLLSDFELVVIDDNSTQDVKGTLINYGSNLNIRYIRIDSRRANFPIYWGPAISNNIGFKYANGDVIVITGPEILQREINLNLLYSSAMNNEAVYGHVLHSNMRFVRLMDQNPNMENYSFERLISIPHARVMDITKNTFYWFLCAVKKEAILAINGCDEEYMKGICGDDDDFANRISEYGLTLTHNYNVLGIHQDHSDEDRKDPKRIRRNNTWEIARLKNTKYLEEWRTKRDKNIIVNKGKDWGSNKYIISNEILSKV